MEIGVGLPSTLPAASGAVLLEWSRRADRGPFASIALLDRPAYQSHDPFPVLAAAAAVTERITLATMIAIGPIRTAAILAKQAASIDQLSGGRLVLGLGLGARAEDYSVTRSDVRTRGRRFSEQLAEIRDAWEDATVCPPPHRPGGPPVLVGGGSGPAYARMARYADGYAHGGGPPRAFARAASEAIAAWTDHGRPGMPRLWGQGYFALGSGDDTEAGAAYLRDYYAFTGPFAEKVVAANLTSPSAIRDFVRGYEDAGCDHLVLFPTVADPAQLDRLADVIG